MRTISSAHALLLCLAGLMPSKTGHARAPPWLHNLPASRVGHRGLRFGRLQMAVLQQLDRNAVGRSHEGHMEAARRAVDRHAGVHQALAGFVNIVDAIGEDARSCAHPNSFRGAAILAAIGSRSVRPRQSSAACWRGPEKISVNCPASLSKRRTSSSPISLKKSMVASGSETRIIVWRYLVMPSIGTKRATFKRFEQIYEFIGDLGSARPALRRHGR